MSVFKSLSHSRWDCKYHVVFIPKGRKKELYGKIREYLKQVFHELARQRSCEIVEGYMAGDHVHSALRSNRNMRFLKLLGISRARVPLRLLGSLAAGNAILVVSAFGLVVMPSRRSDLS